MSCPGDNWIVPSANPNNIQGGVLSIGAATPNVSITGTPSNPLIGVTNTGGVTTLEGLIGNINLNGVGMTIVGATPTAQDVTFTSAVQSIVAGTNCNIVQSPAGTFTINATSGGTLTATTLTTTPSITLAVNGGGSPVIAQNLTGLPAINSAKNPNVFVVLTMSLQGVLNRPAYPNNDFTMGLFNGSSGVVVFNSGLVNQPNYNWGTDIPNVGNNNMVVSGFVPYATLVNPNMAYAVFMSYPWLGTPPYYTFNNVRFSATLYYIV
jgi:hypothetical protein